MKISMIGTGYVGLVTGTCFADAGHEVWCVDKDAEKIEGLRHVRLPIHEPDLPAVVERNVRGERLHFGTSIAEAVQAAEAIFVAVGTPPSADGSVDMAAFDSVIREIALSMNGCKLIVAKSTVPVGTGERVRTMVGRLTSHGFHYASNPEFLKQGAAVADFSRPARVVVGSDSPQAIEQLRRIYAPLLTTPEQFIVMDTTSAELAKYAVNAMLALRISFMNEIANLCEAAGADVEQVREGIGSDPRVGREFLHPGVGYGGFCFPKDVRGLVASGVERGVDMSITQSINKVNLSQRERFVRRVLEQMEDRPAATLAVWGLAYKANTDDTRESPAIWCVRRLLERGMAIRAYDPQAMPKARRELSDSVGFFDDAFRCLDGADALLIFTEWQQFRQADPAEIARRLKGRIVFDGRNLFDPGIMSRANLEYHCVGRPVVFEPADGSADYVPTAGKPAASHTAVP